MSSILPINLDDLLHCRGVESAHVEFKSGWNPRTTGYQTRKTICAFANDYHNLNGGYVVLGVAEEHGRGVLPPAGLTGTELAVDAQANGLLSGLMAQTARVPWDDRRAFDARIEDLRQATVREFLRDVDSGLVDEPSAGEVFIQEAVHAISNLPASPRSRSRCGLDDSARRSGPGRGPRGADRDRAGRVANVRGALVR